MGSSYPIVLGCIVNCHSSVCYKLLQMGRIYRLSLKLLIGRIVGRQGDEEDDHHKADSCCPSHRGLYWQRLIGGNARELEAVSISASHVSRVRRAQKFRRGSCGMNSEVVDSSASLGQVASHQDAAPQSH